MSVVTVTLCADLLYSRYLKMKLILAAVVFGCLGAALANNCDKACNYDYRPVCGSDRQTYSNPCALEVGQCENPDLKKAYNGECECPNICTLDYVPVCGTDGTKYGNLCQLKAAICAQENGNSLIEGAPGSC